MSENCFLKKLKVSVQNENLPVLRVVKATYTKEITGGPTVLNMDESIPANKLFRVIIENAGSKIVDIKLREGSTAYSFTSKKVGTETANSGSTLHATEGIYDMYCPTNAINQVRIDNSFTVTDAITLKVITYENSIPHTW